MLSIGNFTILGLMRSIWFCIFWYVYALFLGYFCRSVSGVFVGFFGLCLIRITLVVFSSPLPLGKCLIWVVVWSYVQSQSTNTLSQPIKRTKTFNISSLVIIPPCLHIYLFPQPAKFSILMVKFPIFLNFYFLEWTKTEKLACFNNIPNSFNKSMQVRY